MAPLLGPHSLLPRRGGLFHKLEKGSCVGLAPSLSLFQLCLPAVCVYSDVLQPFAELPQTGAALVRDTSV